MQNWNPPVEIKSTAPINRLVTGRKKLVALGDVIDIVHEEARMHGEGLLGQTIVRKLLDALGQ